MGVLDVVGAAMIWSAALFIAGLVTVAVSSVLDAHGNRAAAWLFTLAGALFVVALAVQAVAWQ